MSHNLLILISFDFLTTKNELYTIICNKHILVNSNHMFDDAFNSDNDRRKKHLLVSGKSGISNKVDFLLLMVSINCVCC